jgi:hypothetical protein
MTLAATAVSSAVPRVFSETRRLGSAIAARTPNQPLPGKSTPADSNGDAQPTMHSGGTTLNAMAAAVAHGRLDSRGVQHRIEGNDRRAAAAVHGKRANQPRDGQYTRAMAINGSDAAAQ